MGRGLSGIINMLREKEREAGRGIKRGVAGKVSGGAASGFKGMASGVIGSAKESAGRRGSSYGRGGVRKIGEKYYFRANPYSGEGIKKWEPPKFSKEGLMKLSQEGRENLLRANREEYLSRINPYSTPSEYIKSAEAKEKADKLKEKMRLKREEKEGSIKPLYGSVGNRQGVNNRVNGSGVSENLSHYGGRIRSKDYVKKPEPLPFITKRSEEERNRIHNSTHAIINNAKPVNSRSTYGEMNNRISQYGKGRVSVGEINKVKNMYNDVPYVSPEDSDFFKKTRWESYKTKDMADFFKRKSYEKKHNTSKVSQEAIDSAIKKRVDYGDFKKAIPNGMVGKYSVEFNAPSFVDDEEKESIVEDIEKKYGGNNIDNYLKKYGAENLAFDNSLAISTNPAFKDQRLTDIENMTPKERKTLYITYMEKGKDDATKYIKSLNPRIVKRKEKDILRFLGNDSKSRLYALATLNHKNRTLDGYKQTLRLLLGNDKNPPDLEALNKAIIKLENKEGSKQKSLIDGVGITNDIISSLILAYFLKGKSSEIETAKIFGRTYNNQMYSNKEGITLEATNKALKEAKQDALISEIAGRVSSPITNEIIDILRNVKIPIPDNGIIDLITDNLNSALLEKILRKDEIEENK